MSVDKLRQHTPPGNPLQISDTETTDDIKYWQKYMHLKPLSRVALSSCLLYSYMDDIISSNLSPFFRKMTHFRSLYNSQHIYMRELVLKVIDSPSYSSVIMMSNTFIFPSYFATPFTTDIPGSRYDTKGRQLGFVETEVQRLERMALVNASKLRSSSPRSQPSSPVSLCLFFTFIYIYTRTHSGYHSRKWSW